MSRATLNYGDPISVSSKWPLGRFLCTVIGTFYCRCLLVTKKIISWWVGQIGNGKFPSVPRPSVVLWLLTEGIWPDGDRHEGSRAQLHTMNTTSLNSHKSHQDVTSHIEKHGTYDLIPNEVLMADIINQSLYCFTVSIHGTSWSLTTELFRQFPPIGFQMILI